MATENPPVVFTPASQQRSLVESFREVFAYRGYVGYLVKRDLRTNYLQTYLGWIWSLAQPLLTLAIYSIVFGYILQVNRGTASPTGLDNFPAFLFAALIVWGFFRQSANGTMNAFAGSMTLRKKLYFPPVVPSLARTLTNSVELIPEVMMLMVFYITLWAIGGPRTVGITWLAIIPIIIMVGLFGMGVGLFMAVPNVRYGDVSMLFNVFIRLYFYLTPIIWPLSVAQKRFGNRPMLLNIVTWSPATQFVEASRDVLYRLQMPSLNSWVYLFVISTAMFFGGWTRFHRRAGKAAEGQ